MKTSFFARVLGSSRFVVVACSVALAPAAMAETWISTATKALTLKSAIETGSVTGSTPLHIAVALRMLNAGQVQQTLKGMITPGNPLYGTSLTVEQFATQFGQPAAQIQAVKSYLEGFGFSNITVDPNNLVVQADGTATAAELAFNTRLSNFTLGGRKVFANTSDAQVPTSLAATVGSVLGLSNLAISLPPLPNPNNAFNGYTPQDFQIAYDAAYPADAGANSNKQKVPVGCSTAVGVIAEGDLTQVVKDLRSYETTYKLPQVPVTVVNAGIPSPDTSGADEWALDSQTSTGIAQQVAHLYFYVATSLTDSDIGLTISKTVTDNKVKAFNMSFGECEALPYADGAMLLDDELFAEAALQGMTPFASSGDNGSACPILPTNGVPGSGLPDVAYPASSPYVIASGGTDLLTTTDYSYSIETAWNSGGGGISLLETAPFWESYTGGGTTPVVLSAEAGMRGVPDVAMCADPDTCGAIVYVSGATEVVGGTSLASPLSMGSWARIESSHSNKLGFAGPLIYQLAASANATALPPTPPSTGPFNDVVLGTNGLYEALPGWDFTTGLGSWNIYNVNKLIPSTYPH